MKIGVDIRALMDERYSGVPAYTEQLLKELLLQDQKNEYYLFYNSFHDFSKRFASWEGERVRVVATHWPNKIFNYLFQKPFGRPFLDRLVGGVDIFWSPHFNFSSFSAGTKNVLTIHDLSFLRTPRFFSWRKNCWHHLLGLKKIIKRADKIVAISENTKLDLMEIFKVPEEKVTVIYSGLNLSIAELTSLELNNFLAKYKLRPGFILSIGTIEPRKNLDGLIKAYNILRQNNPEITVQLVLAGGAGWRNRHIYQLAGESPFAQDIIFTDYVSEGEKVCLYLQAGMFAFPSFYEGFGFPPLEAISYGLPVLSANTSSLPEVLGDGALLINPVFVNEIADALKVILSDHNVRQKLIIAGRKRLEMFSWKKTAEEYLKLFNSL